MPVRKRGGRPLPRAPEPRRRSSCWAPGKNPHQPGAAALGAPAARFLAGMAVPQPHARQPLPFPVRPAPSLPGRRGNGREEHRSARTRRPEDQQNQADAASLSTNSGGAARRPPPWPGRPGSGCEKRFLFGMPCRGGRRQPAVAATPLQEVGRCVAPPAATPPSGRQRSPLSRGRAARQPLRRAATPAAAARPNALPQTARNTLLPPRPGGLSIGTAAALRQDPGCAQSSGAASLPMRPRRHRRRVSGGSVLTAGHPLRCAGGRHFSIADRPVCLRPRHETR